MPGENARIRNKSMPVRKTWSRRRVLPDLPVHAGAPPAHSWLLQRTDRGLKGRCPPGGLCGHLRCRLHGHCGEGRKESQGPEQGGKRADDANRDPAVLFLSRTCLAVGSHQPRARHLHISSCKRHPNVLVACAHSPTLLRGYWLMTPGPCAMLRLPPEF